MTQNVVSIFQSFVNTNSQYEESYNFPLLDTKVNRNKPYILDIVGDTESLKTRLAFYLANNLLSKDIPVYWISCSNFEEKLMLLEISPQNQEKLSIIFTNSIERIHKIFQELPDNSDIFVDSLISMFSDNPEFMEKIYIYFGRVCESACKKKGHRIHLLTHYSGMNFKPLSDVFNRKIQYRLYLKRYNSFKDFVGLEYKTIGHFFKVSLNEETQVLPASIYAPISSVDVKFFWLVSVNEIEKINRTYVKNGNSLGSSYKKITQNYELIENAYADRRKRI